MYAIRSYYVQDKSHIVQVGAGYMDVSSGKDGFSYSQHRVSYNVV